MRGQAVFRRDNPAETSQEQRAGGGERQLLLQHRNGDPLAFGRLVDAYRRPVFSYLIRCGVLAADRDDLFQEIFLRIHAAAASYEDHRPLHPWLFTVVANAVRTHQRRRESRDCVLDDPPVAELRAVAPDGERSAIARQRVDRLEREIRRLPLAQREVLILACIEHLPQKAIAEILDLPLNTVKTHLRRARLTLVDRLAQAERHVGEVRS